jgi:hypothetical protein
LPQGYESLNVEIYNSSYVKQTLGSDLNFIAPEADIYYVHYTGFIDGFYLSAVYKIVMADAGENVIVSYDQVFSMQLLGEAFHASYAPSTAFTLPFADTVLKITSSGRQFSVPIISPLIKDVSSYESIYFYVYNNSDSPVRVEQSQIGFPVLNPHTPYNCRGVLCRRLSFKGKVAQKYKRACGYKVNLRHSV